MLMASDSESSHIFILHSRYEKINDVVPLIEPPGGLRVSYLVVFAAIRASEARSHRGTLQAERSCLPEHILEGSGFTFASILLLWLF